MRALRRSALLAALACASTTAGAAAATLQARGADGDLVLEPSAAGARLELPSGDAIALPLPRGAELSFLAADGGGWLAAGTEVVQGRTALLLLAGDAHTARRLSAPPPTSGAPRSEPVPLVGGHGLVALAWLEGDTRTALAVHAAAWDGAAWEPAQEVSPPGPGSQLALAGAVLADGTWLLAWSAFDGEDDEILWSGREKDKASWSAPRRIAAGNAVPDITPALVALPGAGALAAWSRYDEGDYRLQIARFDGRAWEPPAIAGPPGSLYPTWLAGTRAAPDPLVLYRTVLPSGWAVLMVDDQGRPRAQAAVAADTPERPVVRRDGQDLVLDWPDRASRARASWRPVL